VRHELALLMDEGLSLPQAVKCATFNVAQLMELKSTGALHPGYCADLIAIHGSPDHLPAVLENIAGLCIHGQWRKTSW
jgi:imidazolonepropionase-like amidohydrolase